jgi:hypothetical protein
MKAQEIQAIAFISQVDDTDLELRTSSTLDVDVLDEAPGASSKVWEGLKDNPYYNLFDPGICRHIPRRRSR